ncbi:MAG TPA: 23S rRNA (uracil(1939)-C(5))-methyltransferase RlmD [Acidobacteriaceae bacterium]|jgi:23S rRNA (uracil1939-C5)-methyltransferase|nr:23S rRNA (uracil(1939)-C(5))-methyltransferase RlmD [Acidobacteriaceae bacterium]
MSQVQKLRIEKAIYGGTSLARLPNGKAAFVPLTLAGELVEARVTEQKRGYAQAEATAILEPAPERIAAPCRHYGLCGGCSYQHAEYAAQLGIKRGILEETLQRAGVTPPAISVHSAERLGEQWGYRNRVRMHFTHEDGRLQLGYKQRRSNTIFAIAECPIAAPVLVRAALALAETLQDAAWIDEDMEAEFFCDSAESTLQIAILGEHSRTSTQDFADTMMQMQQAVPELTGAGLYLRTEEEAAPHEIANWGENSLTLSVASHSYRVTRGAFFQTNRFLAEKLVELVTQERSGELVWDLYAGVGLFSLALAAHFARVVAVEAATPAVRDLQHNLAQAGEQHRAIENTTLDFLKRTAAPSSKKPPELIVLDPPRAGLGAEVCKLLAQVGAPEIVYVSCDPVTLSRDLAALIESGYQLQPMHMVDLFPQTFHLETVSVLRRA